MENEIFTTVQLPVLGTCDILEGKGRHYFRALIKAKGDSSLMIKFLIIELAKPNGKDLTEDMVDEMHLRDISYISEVILAMMNNEFSGGF